MNTPLPVPKPTKKKKLSLKSEKAMKCSICKTDQNSDGTPVRYWRCKNCANLKAKKAYKANPEKFRLIKAKSWIKNREASIAKHKLYEQKIKDQVFLHYGGYKCKCCGELEIKFLTIDHIYGGGTQHRKETKGGGKFHYRWITKNNYPKGFQVLCFNCNSGRALNGGICPHEK